MLLVVVHLFLLHSEGSGSRLRLSVPSWSFSWDGAPGWSCEPEAPRSWLAGCDPRPGGDSADPQVVTVIQLRVAHGVFDPCADYATRLTGRPSTPVARGVQMTARGEAAPNPARGGDALECPPLRRRLRFDRRLFAFVHLQLLRCEG
ncbi:hypothetical protein SCATT_06050 [Streptantibioticus cattleyicolor NRRL 8057 = DSM 46488]|uniref:Uncharacterized protein n=1 Tax=Streptantibioticus cattleyicolor (strain ATCC 35852 / DSM 46488 / JCM 4925 / NBRC 14057 / NRRL 8057) TaxID=1003195 RepID=G8WRF9_STREN|nr:hypothetical protein SCATT_06050 [Streptantibioticus cattleyicolor NRRL 8057 = DSM 46488]